MLTTKDLSSSERLKVWRRRLDKTQVQAAESHGVTTWEYRLLERGARSAPTVIIGSLQPHEACAVMRWRSGYSRKDIARWVGISPWWVTQMERGRIDSDRLINFWFSPL